MNVSSAGDISRLMTRFVWPLKYLRNLLSCRERYLQLRVCPRLSNPELTGKQVKSLSSSPDVVVHLCAGVDASVLRVREPRQVDPVLLRVDQPPLHAALAVKYGNLHWVADRRISRTLSLKECAGCVIISVFTRPAFLGRWKNEQRAQISSKFHFFYF